MEIDVVNRSFCNPAQLLYPTKYEQNPVAFLAMGFVHNRINSVGVRMNDSLG